MRLRNVKNAKDILLSSSKFVSDPSVYKNRWNDYFQNDNPICLEIGTGKGQFLINMARSNPDINFIGIERYESVLVRAVQKEIDDLANIVFICGDAKNITDFLGKEIEVLYLNFSDPWPKKRHSNRRLTADNFLKCYDDIFKDLKRIVLKTDNAGLFSFSLENLSKNGYVLNKVSLDLAHDDIFNVLTEYEERFMALGKAIYYVDATKS